LYLLVLEFLGTNELLVILVVALMILGPRRLPQMSRKLGKSLADFKRASEDFKQTWEREVEMEFADQSASVERALESAQASILDETVGRGSGPQMESMSQIALTADDSTDELPADSITPSLTQAMDPALAPTITSAEPAEIEPASSTEEEPIEAPPAIAQPARKRDWL
jgi:sec-independent protein translocase protein TatB